ncbi:hypothetical protein PT974_01704 [Cladobotryum mycophilum]|uniref:Uncharacterized protein n=1 Tax=Cladobotryum mycophilum TaxID=491253 RepID=A0ABR0SW05_9HYPO
MDEHGYFSFDALAVQVAASLETNLSNRPSPDNLRLFGIDSGNADSSLFREPRSFAVMLGFYNIMPADCIGNNLRGLIVTEHTRDKYNVRSYFRLHTEALRWTSGWNMNHFCIGGPEVDPAAR